MKANIVLYITITKKKTNQFWKIIIIIIITWNIWFYTKNFRNIHFEERRIINWISKKHNDRYWLMDNETKKSKVLICKKILFFVRAITNSSSCCCECIILHEWSSFCKKETRYSIVVFCTWSKSSGIIVTTIINNW